LRFPVASRRRCPAPTLTSRPRGWGYPPHLLYYACARVRARKSRESASAACWARRSSFERPLDRMLVAARSEPFPDEVAREPPRAVTTDRGGTANDGRPERHQRRSAGTLGKDRGRPGGDDDHRRHGRLASQPPDVDAGRRLRRKPLVLHLESGACCPRARTRSARRAELCGSGQGPLLVRGGQR
jgi:hypothetical protein